MTLTIDFMVLPRVFSLIKDVFLGGKIGRALFTSFNHCELVFGLLIVGLMASMAFLKVWHKRAAIGAAIALVLISLLYQFYLTPGIINATNTLDGIPLADIEGRAQAFLTHQFYHQWYIRVDSLKILLLIFLMVLLFLKEEFLNKDQA